MQPIIQHIQTAITNANNCKSKLSEEILNIPGMSSRKVRHLLNNLITNNDRYLEIGTWMGSTLISALYKNNPQYYIAIDNWSEWDGPKNDFFNNCQKYLNYMPNFLEKNCFDLGEEKNNIKDITIYFYDGGHSETDQYRAITYYYECLADNFIILVDDYNSPPVPIGTQNAINDLKIKKKCEIELPADYNGDTNKWWNGLYLAYCEKTT